MVGEDTNRHARASSSGHVHLGDLDRDPGTVQHIGHHKQRLVEAAIGSAAPGAAGQVEEQEIDLQLPQRLL
jgi:hypothetical protein